MAGTRTLLTGLGFGESPRWHENRLWFCNWGFGEVMAVDLDGNSQVVARVPTTIPFSIDWLPDGRLLVVSGQEALVLRQEPGGPLVTHADLTGLDSVFNEIVVDGRGNAYVNGGIIALVRPDGSARQVAGGLEFGNGMAVHGAHDRRRQHRPGTRRAGTRPGRWLAVSRWPSGQAARRALHRTGRCSAPIRGNLPGMMRKAR